MASKSDRAIRDQVTEDKVRMITLNEENNALIEEMGKMGLQVDKADILTIRIKILTDILFSNERDSISYELRVQEEVNEGLKVAKAKIESMRVKSDLTQGVAGVDPKKLVIPGQQP